MVFQPSRDACSDFQLAPIAVGLSVSGSSETGQPLNSRSVASGAAEFQLDFLNVNEIGGGDSVPSWTTETPVFPHTTVDLSSVISRPCCTPPSAAPSTEKAAPVAKQNRELPATTRAVAPWSLNPSPSTERTWQFSKTAPVASRPVPRIRTSEVPFAPGPTDCRVQSLMEIAPPSIMAMSAGVSATVARTRCTPRNETDDSAFRQASPGLMSDGLKTSSGRDPLPAL